MISRHMVFGFAAAALLLSGGGSAWAQTEAPPADSQLTKLQEQFKRQKSTARLSALAAYADQLRALRDTLKKTDPAGAAKVNEELVTVLQKLAGVIPLPNLPPPAPVDAKMEAAFKGQGEKDEEPAEAGPETLTAPDGTPIDPRARRITLKIKDATNINPRDYGRDHWSSEGMKLTWNLEEPEVAPGFYHVLLNYTAAAGSGGGKGELRLSGNAEGQPFQITGKSTWKNPQRITVAKIDLRKLPQKLTVASVSLAEGAEALFDLRNVMLVADNGAVAGKVETKRPPPSPAPTPAPTSETPKPPAP